MDTPLIRVALGLKTKNFNNRSSTFVYGGKLNTKSDMFLRVMDIRESLNFNIKRNMVI